MDASVNSALTNETVELLQQMIRNKCVNDGSVASGQESRTTDLLRAYFQGSGLDLEIYEPDGAPGRKSLVAADARKQVRMNVDALQCHCTTSTALPGWTVPHAGHLRNSMWS